MKYKYLFIAILFSCTTNSDLEQQFTLENAGTLTIELDSLTSYKNSFYDIISFGNKDYLGVANKIDNSIRLINLEDPLIQKKISFGNIPELNGGSISAFAYVNEDSVFLFGEFGSFVALFSLNRGLQKLYDFRYEKDTTQRLFGFARRFLDSSSKPFYLDSKLYLSGFEEYPLNNPNIHFEKAELEIVLDLSSESYGYIKTHWPKMYAKGIYLPVYGRTINPETNELIYNYIASDSLTIYDLNSMKSKNVMAGSSYLNRIQPANESASIENYFNRTPAYVYSTYESSNKMLFRAVDHGKSKENFDSGNELLERQYSIIVLDSNYNVITEKLLDINKYDIHDFFVNEGFIYLSESNENNPKLDENKLRFSKFELSKQK